MRTTDAFDVNKSPHFRYEIDVGSNILQVEVTYCCIETTICISHLSLVLTLYARVEQVIIG